MNKTKLVTIGPKSLKKNIIQKMDDYGIFVFRINLSHTSINHLKETITTIKIYTNTPICLDSEGAQIRNRKMLNDKVILKDGENIRIFFGDTTEESRNLSLTPFDVAEQLKEGDVLNVDFHNVSLKVTGINQTSCDALVVQGGKVGSNKAVDLQRDIPLLPITPKDEKAIEIGLRMGIEHFALSFTNRKSYVEDFRSKIGNDSYLISKIESISELLNIEDILNNSDAILIDRGDLSRQVPIEKIPLFQRRIISLARYRKKDVYVATNLLESMVETKQPTRAETNDVVSTLEMGASGLVLAAETAVGNYPLECVEMIAKLIDEFECWTPNISIEELLSNS